MWLTTRRRWNSSEGSLEAHPAEGRTLAVYGTLADKPVETICRIMGDSIDAWYVGSIIDERGASATQVIDAMHTVAAQRVSGYGSVVEAFEAARRDVVGNDRILVFGSFHTVGDIIRVLRGE